jgi:hypothetical protein
VNALAIDAVRVTAVVGDTDTTGPARWALP